MVKYQTSAATPRDRGNQSTLGCHLFCQISLQSIMQNIRLLQNTENRMHDSSESEWTQNRPVIHRRNIIELRRLQGHAFHAHNRMRRILDLGLQEHIVRFHIAVVELRPHIQRFVDEELEILAEIHLRIGILRIVHRAHDNMLTKLLDLVGYDLSQILTRSEAFDRCRLRPSVGQAETL